MNDALLAALPTWAERWRYPALAAALEVAGGLDDTNLLDAILDGLANPVTDAPTAVRRLVDDGHLRAATALCQDDDVMSMVTVTEREALLTTIFDGEQAMLAYLERRRNELTQRMLRVEAAMSEPAGLREAIGCRSDLDALLDGWARRIDEVEDNRARDILEELRGHQVDAPEWVAAVEDCVTAGELLAAIEILRAGPEDHAAASLAVAVRSSPIWPWGNLSVAELLQWYAEPTLAQPGFNLRWRPLLDDAAAHAVVEAVRALRASVDLASVTEFVRSFHALLDVDGVTHRVEPAERGYRVELCGLADPRLPDELLPKRLPLWLGPPGWTPPVQDRAAIWFRLDPESSPAPAGLAVLTPQTVFQLVAPDSGRIRAASTRRIQLLRDLYRQFDLDDLIGPATPLRFEPAAARTATGWLFDLLGVRVDGVTLDTLLYDTARHPVLLRGALDHLVGARANRSSWIGVKDLADWRADRSSAERLCIRLLDGMPPPSKAVLAAAVLLVMDFGDMTFTDEDLAGRLREAGAGAEEEGLRQRAFDLVDVPWALTLLTEAGLVTPAAGGHRLRGSGLVALLTAGADWTAVAIDALHLLSERLDAVMKGVHKEVSQQAVVHWIKNDLEALDLTLDSIKPHIDQLPRELREVWSLLTSTLSKLHEARQAASEDILDLLRFEQVDLVPLLDTLVITEGRYQRRVDITLDADRNRRFIVRASRFVLEQAIRNLLTNSVQQFLTGGPGRIQVRLRQQTDRAVVDGPGDWVLIEVEDSGPGLSAEQRARFDAGEQFTNRRGGEGKGLRHARAHVDYCDGRLTLELGNGRLGGAHFVIRLPLLPEPLAVTE